MITAYVKNGSALQAIEIKKANQDIVHQALWIDLLTPTRKEEKIIENLLDIEVPTKKEMVEIEPSSRLYIEDDALFMTATMVAKSDSSEPKTDAVTFILSNEKLITVRYIEPQSFSLFISRLSRSTKKEYDAIKLFITLLEVTTDRLADILENVSHEFDKISHTIFHDETNDSADKVNYQNVLRNIGANGDLGTKVRESLVSFIRLVSFFQQTLEESLNADIKLRLTIINKDINSLSDYAGFISTKVNFLLDATLGMVNIEQNNIIKIFSVAAVIFLPPTLIASIYGMNFKFIPELDWHIGYPVSIGLMLISAWLPFRYFKKKKWL